MPIGSSEEHIRRLVSSGGDGSGIFTTCWQRLGIPQGSDPGAVTRAYRQLSLLVHPDKAPPELAEEAHIAFHTLSESFSQALRVARESAPPVPEQWGSSSSQRAAEKGSRGEEKARERPGRETFGAGWWEGRKLWELEEVLKRFEAEFASEVQEGSAMLDERKERRQLKRRERDERVAREQEDWLEEAQEVAETRADSWRSFVRGKGPLKRSKKKGERPTGQ